MGLTRSTLAVLFAAWMLTPSTLAQQVGSGPTQFGGSYAELDARRQAFVADWVRRFNELTGQKVAPQPFYDSTIGLSTKTTFDAVTNALIATPLTDESGAKYGDALDLIERVESVKGQILNASGDRQYRMYVRLRENALSQLDRSKEFERGADNTIFHKGYPTNYRQQGGIPSIQISIAVDGRRGDIDVDYRSSSFPIGLFNGHLSSSNSDVRAGNNFDRHTNRWAGFQNWWRNVFGIRVGGRGDAPEEPPDLLSATPRLGDKTIDLMVNDFLKAWLVDGDIMGAMSYVSERAYACLADEGDQPYAFDRGMAPYHLMMNLRAAHEALGQRESLEGLVVGVRLTTPGLKVVRQTHHSQFVIYVVPDDIAAAFDCESRLTLADSNRVRREYGNYFGATFYLDGQQAQSLALLWGREHGYWKIVSWQSEPEGEDERVTRADTPAVPVTRAREQADSTLVDAAKTFLESWLIRKDYETTFNYLALSSYDCYNLVRDPDSPEATSAVEAAQMTRAALERAGTRVGAQKQLETLLAPALPFHPAVHLLRHPYQQTFTLTSLPNGLVEAADCASRARGDSFMKELGTEYGKAYGMNFRFRTKSGETPVLRMLWLRDPTWRIAAYDVENP